MKLSLALLVHSWIMIPSMSMCLLFSWTPRCLVDSWITSARIPSAWTTVDPRMNLANSHFHDHFISLSFNRLWVVYAFPGIYKRKSGSLKVNIFVFVHVMIICLANQRLIWSFAFLINCYSHIIIYARVLNVLQRITHKFQKPQALWAYSHSPERKPNSTKSQEFILSFTSYTDMIDTGKYERIHFWRNWTCFLKTIKKIA